MLLLLFVAVTACAILIQKLKYVCANLNFPLNYYNNNYSGFVSIIFKYYGTKSELFKLLHSLINYITNRFCTLIFFRSLFFHLAILNTPK